MMENSNYKYLSQTIQKALDVLLAFAEKPEWGVTELSETLDLPKSTVHRALVNLEMRGLLENDNDTGVYKAGIKLFVLGTQARDHRELREVAHPYLEELTRKTGETTVLSILSEGKALYLDKVSSPKAVSATSSVGQRLPLQCTAVGKVLLAGLPLYRVPSVMEQTDLAPCTSNSIIDPEQLYEEIASVRRQRYATDIEEYENDLCCVATPVMDSTGAVVASIGIGMPKTRFMDWDLLELVDLMQFTAKAISQEMGHAI